MNTKWLKISITGVIGLVFIVGILSTFPFSWNESLTDVAGDLLFQMRGERQLSDEFVLVFIGPEDIRQLKDYPITRDYYGYMTHVLKELGAKVIGFDLLFDSHDPHYPEYDAAFADFLQSAGNVCLPMAFSELVLSDSSEHEKNPPQSLFEGRFPTYPIEEFMDRTAALGFSNLGNETIIHRIPVVVKSADSLLFSYGAELARLFLGGKESKMGIDANHIFFAEKDDRQFSLPIDKLGRIRLNHFGSVQRITSISFIDLLKAYQTNPDQLDLSGKLVLVAVTSPGIAPLKVTPLAPALPASLIHATVAENIIHNNYLRDFSKGEQLFLIILLPVFIFLFWFKFENRGFIIGSVSAIIVYWIVVFFSFTTFNQVLSLVYPTFSSISTVLFLGWVTHYRLRWQNVTQKELYQTQIIEKYEQLETAQQKLNELQIRIQTEMAAKEKISRENQEQIEEQRQAVFNLESQLRDLQTYVTPQKPKSQQSFPEIIYSDDSKMVQILSLVEKVGADNIPVLISGETGTGKEVIARAIHKVSLRKKAPFVAVNCGALPETLLESELFGHEKGSFTGAQSQRRGRFELANGGTLFLDEITETTPAFQAKLLRVLQEGVFERLGGEKSLQVDVRIIAASSKDLKTEVSQGRFREDLFYRLNGFPILLPPLRERKQDISLLAEYFLSKHGYTGAITGFSDRVMDCFLTYHWHGNVRELENVVRRVAILAQAENRQVIQTRDLPDEMIARDESNSAGFFIPFEEQILETLRSLKFSYASISQTAKELGNKDRGTITEYFRGICFEQLINAEYDLTAAAKEIAATDEAEVVERVEGKIMEYINNLDFSSYKGDEQNEVIVNTPQFRGLPKKYHPCLQKIIRYYSKKTK